MTSGIRRTADGLEFTHRTVRALLGLVAVLALGATMLVRKNDKIDGSVQRQEFRDTTRAIRSDLSTIATKADVANVNAAKAAQQAVSIGCYIAKYPVALCDNVPRARP